MFQDGFHRWIALKIREYIMACLEICLKKKRSHKFLRVVTRLLIECKVAIFELFIKIIDINYRKVISFRAGKEW